MKSAKIAIITSETSWYIGHAKKLVSNLEKSGYNVDFFSDHKNIVSQYDIVFLLSYFNLIPSEFLSKSDFNLVIHESNLPEGRGWAPFFWQVLEGKKEIPIVLFKASNKVDEGEIFLKDYIHLSGHELYDELRILQAQKTEELCRRFLREYPNNISCPQKGAASYYPKRTQKDSELNIHKTIDEQFNNLRIVNNQDFPAFFVKDGLKYKLKIEKMN